MASRPAPVPLIMKIGWRQFAGSRKVSNRLKAVDSDSRKTRFSDEKLVLGQVHRQQVTFVVAIVPLNNCQGSMLEQPFNQAAKHMIKNGISQYPGIHQCHDPERVLGRSTRDKAVQIFCAHQLTPNDLALNVQGLLLKRYNQHVKFGALYATPSILKRCTGIERKGARGLF